MSALTLDIEDKKIESLKKIASRIGVSPDDLIKASLEDFLSNPSDEFEKSLKYLLNKNKELYDRLS